jgi:hypothetical protein
MQMKDNVLGERRKMKDEYHDSNNRLMYALFCVSFSISS